MKRKTGGLPYWKRDGSVIFLLADGTSGDHTDAYPLLDAQKWPAMSLLVTDKVDDPGRLTTAQVQELDRAGWDMSVHAYTHLDPTLLPDDADGVAPWDAGSLQEQLYESRAWMAAAGIVNGTRHYSPPQGMNAHVASEALAFGFTHCFKGALSEYDVLPQPYTYFWQRCEDAAATMDQIKDSLMRVYRQRYNICFFLLERMGAGNTTTTRLAAIIQLLRDWDITPTTLSTLMRRI